MAAVVAFFCTSGGAVCAGSAQVTLVELRWSYKPGCNQQEETQQQNNQTNKQTNPQVICWTFIIIQHIEKSIYILNHLYISSTLNI